MFGRAKKLPEISTSPDGFMVDGIYVAWPSIVSIAAYKMDLVTYDLICFAIKVDGNDQSIQLSEEWPGFKTLSYELGSRFVFPEGWGESLAFPAFKTNEMLLYQRL